MTVNTLTWRHIFTSWRWIAFASIWNAGLALSAWAVGFFDLIAARMGEEAALVDMFGKVFIWGGLLISIPLGIQSLRLKRKADV